MMMGVVTSLKTFHVLLFILAVRLASVFLVQTWYVPDEYWQMLEVAHSLTFSYGHLTWEWTAGIRSYIPPALVHGLYKLLELLSIDIPELLIVVPRVLQAILSACGDYAVYKWSGRHKWALFLISVQWFWFYTASRTIVNTTEAALLAVALARFPFTPSHYKDHSWLCLAALTCVIRPTAGVIWLPLCLYQLITTTESRARLIAFKYIPIGVSMLGLSTLVDSYFHGSLIFTPWEFLKFNVINEIGSFYGSQPWYWYPLIGFPAVLGVNIIPFVVSSVEAINTRGNKAMRTQHILLAVILFVLAVYSFLPHKEYRFLLPLLPMTTYLTQDTLSRWSRKASLLSVRLVFVVLLVGNIVPAAYVSLVHQRGPLDAMPILRQIAQTYPTNTSLLFLMPCHSTPLYSHLHTNIPVRFLTCEPNLSGKAEYRDEADIFYSDPERWFQREYLAQRTGETTHKSKLPSHIIFYDSLAPAISNILAYYNPMHTLYHTQYPLEDRIGYNIQIHERAVGVAPSKSAPPKKAPVAS